MKCCNFKNKNKGFTLLEILLVVGIIAILAGIVIIAINPSRQLAVARNTERKSDLKQINNALQQYYIDHREYPDTLTDTPTDICDTGDTASSSVTGVYGEGYCDDLIDLSVLVPTYLTAIPKDPQVSIASSAGYKVKRHSSGGRIGLSANAELEQVITINIPVEEVYTVTFNTDGGSTAPSAITDIVSGDTITLPSDPTKEGYTFDGWYTEINGGGIEFTESTVVVADITIYAKWTEVIVDACSHSASDPDCWSDYKIEGGNVYWGPLATSTNASSTTNGLANSNILKNLSGDYPAADACAALTEDGYAAGTWYLPAIDELALAYTSGVTGFSNPGAYWSSTENPFSNNFAKLVFFEDGHQNSYSKTTSGFDVRCLR